MVSRILVTVLVLAACAHYSASVRYFIQKSSYKSKCQEMDCGIGMGGNNIKCTAKWTECGPRTDIFIIGDHKNDTFQLVDERGKKCPGKTLTLTFKESYFAKFTININGKTDVMCGTRHFKPNDNEKKALVEECSGQELKDVDNSDCKT